MLGCKSRLTASIMLPCIIPQILRLLFMERVTCYIICSPCHNCKGDIVSHSYFPLTRYHSVQIRLDLMSNIPEISSITSGSLEPCKYALIARLIRYTEIKPSQTETMQVRFRIEPEAQWLSGHGGVAAILDYRFLYMRDQTIRYIVYIYIYIYICIYIYTYICTLIQNSGSPVEDFKKYNNSQS